MIELESWTCSECGETHVHEKDVFMWRCPICHLILKDAAQVQTITFDDIYIRTAISSVFAVPK